MGAVIAATYDFYQVPGDDVNRTMFYTAALTTWGVQLIVYYYGYRALNNHIQSAGHPQRDRQIA